jgi:YD repeat-containing protein
VNFTYENNSLKTASRNNEDGLEITYSLINNVNTVEQKSGTLLTNRITFDNRGKTTYITDKDGYVTKKMYDDYGRYTGTVNPLGILNKISYYDHDINSNYHNIHKIIGTSSSIESFANLIKNGEFEYSAPISDNWTTASNIPNGGTYSYYQCVTGSESLCQKRVNSGKKSLYLNKYSSSSYYMLYQTVNIKQGYYSLSAYASADLGIDVDDTDSDPNDLIFQNVQPHVSKINSDENPNFTAQYNKILGY